MLIPVRVEPVNWTKSTSSTTAAPVAPAPGAHPKTAGAPISRHPSTARSAASGVSSEGLTTSAAPASSAGMLSTRTISNGTFHGAITPTTG